MPEEIPPVKAGDRVLEITNRETGEVGHRSIVTGWADRQVAQLERGMSINLDHANWYVNDRTVTEDDEAKAAPA